MKRMLTIIVAMAAFLAAENTADAQLLKKLFGGKSTTATTETTSAAVSNGKAAGAALKSLYTQYKTDGKLDMTNINNILNITTLSTNLQGIKGQSDKSAFYKDFVSGLILGSENLVTESNSSSVMSGLTSLVENVDLSGLTQQNNETASSASSTLTEKLAEASGKASTASEVASAVTNILNLFK